MIATLFTWHLKKTLNIHKVVFLTAEKLVLYLCTDWCSEQDSTKHNIVLLSFPLHQSLNLNGFNLILLWSLILPQLRLLVLTTPAIMSPYLKVRTTIIINFDTNQSRFTSFSNSHHNQGISDKILWSFFLPFTTTTFCGKTPFNCQKKSTCLH